MTPNIRWYVASYLVAIVTFVAAGVGALATRQSPLESAPSKVVTIVTDNHLGSGAYVSPDGLVLTCAHLFLHSKGALILVQTKSGSVSKAELVRLDIEHDLAVIKVAPVHPVPFFTLGSVYIGDKVYAYGSPLAIKGTMTQGYVANLDVGKSRFTVHGAAINPGNSGGPLVNERGQLVGVNVSINMLSDTMRAEGLSNAVNMYFIRRILED